MSSLILAVLAIGLCGCATQETAALADNTGCSSRAEGETVFMDCADGSHFQGPASGGIAYGFDKHGNDLQGYIDLEDGKYYIRR